jgi:two-component system sensor histidine kinase UhpB
MNTREHVGSESARGILFEVAAIIAVAVVCALTADRFDLSERLFAWTRRFESLQLDELAFVLLSLVVGLAWFSLRRWRGARRELAARLQVQRRLAQTLGEQRRLAAQLVELQERERKRISQELHDELGQFVNAIKLDAVAIRTALADAPLASVPAERAHSIMMTADLMHESVARLIRELRPVGLDELGLSAALEHCVSLWRKRLTPARISLHLDQHIEALEEAPKLAVYRTVQEALTNCARHAHASRVEVRVAWMGGEACGGSGALVSIEDDGVGTDLNSAPSGLGLVGMRERVTALGGSLSIESSPRAGFRLLARVPAAAAIEA